MAKSPILWSDSVKNAPRIFTENCPWLAHDSKVDCSLPFTAIIGSFSNDEDHINENGIKAIALGPVYRGWGTPGRRGYPPVHIISHFNLITFT